MLAHWLAAHPQVEQVFYPGSGFASRLRDGKAPAARRRVDDVGQGRHRRAWCADPQESETVRFCHQSGRCARDHADARDNGVSRIFPSRSGSRWGPSPVWCVSRSASNKSTTSLRISPRRSDARWDKARAAGCRLSRLRGPFVSTGPFAWSVGRRPAGTGDLTGAGSGGRLCPGRGNAGGCPGSDGKRRFGKKGGARPLAGSARSAGLLSGSPGWETAAWPDRADDGHAEDSVSGAAHHRRADG